MKKEFALLILILLFVNFVSALNETVSLSGIGSASSAKDKTNAFLEKEVEIPEDFQILTRILFSLEPGSKINFQSLVIFTALWLLIFFLLHSIIEIMPFFEGWKSWVGDLMIMLLIGIAGGFRLAAGFILSLSSLFGKVEGWKLLNLVISVIILAGLFYLFAKVSKMPKSGARVGEARQTGENIGIAAATGETQRRAMEEEKK